MPWTPEFSNIWEESTCMISAIDKGFVVVTLNVVRNLTFFLVLIFQFLKIEI